MRPAKNVLYITVISYNREYSQYLGLKETNIIFFVITVIVITMKKYLIENILLLPFRGGVSYLQEMRNMR